jgi:hypothetical protein
MCLDQLLDAGSAANQGEEDEPLEDDDEVRAADEGDNYDLEEQDDE